MLPVCLWYNVAYGIYETSGCIESSYKYKHNRYADKLDNFFK